MIAKLGAAGWQLEADAERADTVVINTCAFIDPAKAESTESILEHASQKRPGQQLVVAGCLAQRYGEQLQSAHSGDRRRRRHGRLRRHRRVARRRRARAAPQCACSSTPSRSTIFFRA